MAPTPIFYGRNISRPPIDPDDFGVNFGLIMLMQQHCQFHGLPREDPNKFLSDFLQFCDTVETNGIEPEVYELIERVVNNQCLYSSEETIAAKIAGNELMMEQIYSSMKNQVAEVHNDPPDTHCDMSGNLPQGDIHNYSRAEVELPKGSNTGIKRQESINKGVQRLERG
ncbi:hypothetical protein AHAS_Ahas16G0204400 [Arachis hypogaea]